MALSERFLRSFNAAKNRQVLAIGHGKSKEGKTTLFSQFNLPDNIKFNDIPAYLRKMAIGGQLSILQTVQTVDSGLERNSGSLAVEHFIKDVCETLGLEYVAPKNGENKPKNKPKKNADVVKENGVPVKEAEKV